MRSRAVNTRITPEGYSLVRPRTNERTPNCALDKGIHYAQQITLDEAADILGVCKKSVRRLIQRGELRAYRVGNGTRMIRVDRADLDKVLHQVTPNGKRR